MLYVVWFSVRTDQAGQGHSFAAVAMHICITEEMVRVTIIFLLLWVVCHGFVLLLLNTCYFGIPPFLAEGLSLYIPLHQENIVNTTMQPVESRQKQGGAAKIDERQIGKNVEGIGLSDRGTISTFASRNRAILRKISVRIVDSGLLGFWTSSF
jgi:hypothetical protein